MSLNQASQRVGELRRASAALCDASDQIASARRCVTEAIAASQVPNDRDRLLAQLEQMDQAQERLLAELSSTERELTAAYTEFDILSTGGTGPAPSDPTPAEILRNYRF